MRWRNRRSRSIEALNPPPAERPDPATRRPPPPPGSLPKIPQSVFHLETDKPTRRPPAPPPPPPTLPMPAGGFVAATPLTIEQLKLVLDTTHRLDPGPDTPLTGGVISQTCPHCGREI